MSSHLKGHLGRVLAMLPATIAVLCVFATLAAAQNQTAPAATQDRPAPKW